MVKLPKKVVIGGVDYNVSFPHKLVTGSTSYDLIGIHDTFGTRICILKEINGYLIPDNRIISTFTHEIIHAIDTVWLGDVLEEEEVDLIAKAVYQLLYDNDLCLCSNDLPEFIRIGAIIYNIEYIEYNLDDLGEEKILSKPDPDLNIIYVRTVDFDTFSPFSNDTIKRAIMQSIVGCMYCEYKFNDELIEKINLSNLMNGLFQVIKHNKLNELVAKYCR